MGDYARRRPFPRGVPLPTLVHNAEEIAPRELKPALYELEGISRESVEAHYKLYDCLLYTSDAADE